MKFADRKCFFVMIVGGGMERGGILVVVPYQAKPGRELGDRMIRRGEGGGVGKGGPLCSPGAGGVIALPHR